jgi:hypothetical protein
MFFPAVSFTTSIGAGLSQSANITVGNTVLDTLLVPTGWTAANITLLGSIDGTTFFPVHDAAGAEVILNAAADRIVRFPPDFRIGFPFLRVRSGTTATPVNQAAARTVEIRGVQW